MGVLDTASGMFGKGFAKLSSYWWIFVPIVLIISIALIVSWVKKFRKKKAQWTHRLKVRRVISPDGRLSEAVVHLMRRFTIVHRADVFELEKPLLGAYLIPELGAYSGLNEFSIIIDQNNRIYTNQGEFFKPDNKSINVSGRHAEIDLARQRLKENYQKINAIEKKVDWVGIAKYGMIIIALIVGMIIALRGLDNWKEAREADAQKAVAEAQAYENLNKVMMTIDTTVKTQQLQITKMLEELYETKNLQSKL